MTSFLPQALKKRLSGLGVPDAPSPRSPDQPSGSQEASPKIDAKPTATHAAELLDVDSDPMVSALRDRRITTLTDDDDEEADAEGRDYQKTDGPIRRKHFEEYVELARAQDMAQRKQLIEAMRVSADNAFERKRLVQQNAQLEKRLRVLTNTLEDAGGVKALIAHRFADDGSYLPGSDDDARAEVQREASWNAANFDAEEGASGAMLRRASSHRAAGQFLRDDALGQALELAAEVRVARCKLALLAGDWGYLDQTAARAGELVERLAYAPLAGRLRLYGGIARLAMGDLDGAEAQLAEAVGACGKYREGELVEGWMAKLRRAKEGKGALEEIVRRRSTGKSVRKAVEESAARARRANRRSTLINVSSNLAAELAGDAMDEADEGEEEIDGDEDRT